MSDDEQPEREQTEDCPGIGTGGYHSREWYEDDDGVCQWCGERAPEVPPIPDRLRARCAVILQIANAAYRRRWLEIS